MGNLPQTMDDSVGPPGHGAFLQDGSLVRQDRQFEHWEAEGR